MSVGENIKKYRKKAGLSQQDLADKTGLSIGTIQGYEQGRYIPKYTNLKKIADVLKVFDYQLNPDMIMSFDTPEQFEKHKSEIIKSASLEKLLSTIVSNSIDDSLQKLSTTEKLLDSFNKLNGTGRVEAVKRVNELTHIPEYTDPWYKHKK